MSKRKYKVQSPGALAPFVSQHFKEKDRKIYSFLINLEQVLFDAESALWQHSDVLAKINSLRNGELQEIKRLVERKEFVADAAYQAAQNKAGIEDSEVE